MCQSYWRRDQGAKFLTSCQFINKNRASGCESSCPQVEKVCVLMANVPITHDNSTFAEHNGKKRVRINIQQKIHRYFPPSYVGFVPHTQTCAFSEIIHLMPQVNKLLMIMRGAYVAWGILNLVLRAIFPSVDCSEFGRKTDRTPKVAFSEIDWTCDTQVGIARTYDEHSATVRILLAWGVSMLIWIDTLILRQNCMLSHLGVSPKS